MEDGRISLARDAFEALCRARDALDAGPADGPERAERHRQYLKVRIGQYNRVERVPPVLHRVPAMNHRFFKICWFASNVLLAEENQGPRATWGDGNGWGEPGERRPYRMVLGKGMAFRRAPTLLKGAGCMGTHILPRSLLDIWQHFDPAALDILPIQLEGRRKQPAPEDYFFVDIIRRLPAFDLAAMEVFVFRQPKPYADRIEYFPAPRVFALRDDLPVEGVHLFRDANWGETYFVSAELRKACLDAGFTDIPFARPEAPDEIVLHRMR